MLAVDPAYQRQGAGAALTEAATSWLRASGMRVAMVETGGDPGHAPARRVYQRAGSTALPVARYFKALPPTSKLETAKVEFTGDNEISCFRRAERTDCKVDGIKSREAGIKVRCATIVPVNKREGGNKNSGIGE